MSNDRLDRARDALADASARVDETCADATHADDLREAAERLGDRSASDPGPDRETIDRHLNELRRLRGRIDDDAAIDHVTDAIDELEAYRKSLVRD